MFVLGLLVSCAPMSPYEAVQSPVLRKAAQSARTCSDHEALTIYFETLARDMQAKAEEQRKLLEHYQAKSYLSGRQAQDQQSHTWALMRKYEQAVEESLTEAALHRRMAAEVSSVRNDNATASPTYKSHADNKADSNERHR
ncbi:MAG: hypothetical protein ABIW02_02970 [Nitrosospira sp.]